MTDIKIVTGLNFGDEGKGLMTDYFAAKAIDEKKKCLVVCHNGGSQRGHTVVLPNGIRHVFHHFGSGTLAGADTYLSQDFIVNPMIFRKEFLQLEAIGVTPKCYIHPYCRASLPYDMMINQIVEDSRGDNRHGSCGMGIWETIVRGENGFSSLIGNIKCSLENNVNTIRHTYLPRRLLELGVKSISTDMLSLINNEDVVNNYMNDLEFMLQHIEMIDIHILQRYDTVIFEGGQGLLLDQSKDAVHSTPSNTGSHNPMRIIRQLRDIQIDSMELCYVTRSYLTKHGAGDFPEECKKEEINPFILDMTNIPNEYQGSIRYGRINDQAANQMRLRILDDCQSARLLNGVASVEFNSSIAITHINECNPVWMYDVFSSCDKKYLSNGLTRLSVLKA